VRNLSDVDHGRNYGEIEAEAAHYPKRDAVCIDALKIVQRHRGWVSDESLRDIAAHLGMSPRTWIAWPRFTT
jgi:NADH:ubiquinone oxidoreductase subunit E